VAEILICPNWFFPKISNLLKLYSLYSLYSTTICYAPERI